jgi:plasmid stabilization system protein ParE
MQVKFEPAAEADLAEAREWYGSQRAGLDVALMRRVEETLQRIVSAPHSYPLGYRQFRRAVPRQFPLAIFYQSTKDEVRVFAVYHSRRDHRKLKSRFRS